MTEHGPDRTPRTAWQLLKPEFNWLNHLVSWKAIIAALVVVALLMGAFVATGGVNVSADQPDSWAAVLLGHRVAALSALERGEHGVTLAQAGRDFCRAVRSGQ